MHCTILLLGTLPPINDGLTCKVLEISLSDSLTASDPGTLSTFRELLNVSALDPLLPTLLLAALSLCILLVFAYHSLALTWELFWASRQSPSLLDLPTEVVLTESITGVVNVDLDQRFLCAGFSGSCCEWPTGKAFFYWS